MAQSVRHPLGTYQAPESTASSPLQDAVMLAVAYSDIFDYPLTATEIHRYLVGMRASWPDVHAYLEGVRSSPGRLRFHDGYFLMQGREGTVEVRRRRAEVAAEMWPRAWLYGASLARLPFVRMVAVTGALAMDNVDRGTDIDYLVVTTPGRLWLCRALVVGMVKLASRRGDTICPNYFLSERALTLGEPNLFTAHELAQMIPLAGMDVYKRMCHLNSWAVEYLPNAFDAPRRVGVDVAPAGHVGPSCQPEGSARKPLAWQMAEAMLRSPLGTPIEEWEMGRKIRKLRDQSGPAPAGNGVAAEINLSADRCKGHFDSHRQRTLEAFSERMRALSVGPIGMMKAESPARAQP